MKRKAPPTPHIPVLNACYCILGMDGGTTSRSLQEEARGVASAVREGTRSS